MRINYDEADDAIYIRFSESKYYQSEELRDGVILDFDKKGKIIALEVLDVSKHLPKESMDSINLDISHPKRRKLAASGIAAG